MAVAVDPTGIRRVTVLGATGSVGRNTVDLIAEHPDRFATAALTANRDVATLASQARRVRARRAVVADPACYQDLKRALAGTGIECAAGPQAVVEAAGEGADVVIAAIVGAAGLAPTVAAARQGAVVGIANKESLVCAGDLLLAEARANGATIVPVDSEHSAIFQVFDSARPDAIDRVILTASGGPFRTAPVEAMGRATPAEAVAHPVWSMGAKISIDSATMMNKGLEVIEAHVLFGLPEARISVLVHPQSIVHSMVEYVDGSILAQLGAPDMRTPISVALAWPGRLPAANQRLDFATLKALTFEAPDPVRFPALRLAREALRAGMGATNILNAANEVAVAAFMAGEIGFLDIAGTVETCLAQLQTQSPASLDDVIATDIEARRHARDIIDARSASPRRAASGARYQESRQ